MAGDFLVNFPDGLSRVCIALSDAKNIVHNAGLNQSTFYQYALTEKIPTIKLGTIRMIEKDILDFWIEERRSPAKIVLYGY